MHTLHLSACSVLHTGNSQLFRFSRYDRSGRLPRMLAALPPWPLGRDRRSGQPPGVLQRPRRVFRHLPENGAIIRDLDQTRTGRIEPSPVVCAVRYVPRYLNGCASLFLCPRYRYYSHLRRLVAVSLHPVPFTPVTISLSASPPPDHLFTTGCSRLSQRHIQFRLMRRCYR
jgi:hypothetical protein